jgi:hypothetical protein
MTSARQFEANRTNARASTGPRTPTGKERASRNALRHGLHTDLPVIPGERPEDWQAHLEAIRQSLAPAGALEEALAERVALALWRLRRVATYETAVTVVGLERTEEEFPQRPPLKPPSALAGLTLTGPDDDAQLPPAEALGRTLFDLDEKQADLADVAETVRLLEQLPELPDEAPLVGEGAGRVLQEVAKVLAGDGSDVDPLGDDGFLVAVGVPETEWPGAEDWTGWTAGLVRAGLAHLAREDGHEPEEAQALTLERLRFRQTTLQIQVNALKRKAKEQRRQLQLRADWQRRERMLPDGNTLQQVTRYEAHLSRQMLQALHELQRLQAARGGESVPPPAALDVTLNGPEAAAVDGETAGGA